MNYRAKELDLKLPLFEAILPRNDLHLKRAVEMVLDTGKKKIAMLGLTATAKTASFHHVGFAVASIEKLAPGFARSLGGRWDGEIIHDPLQEARVAFLYCGDKRNPAVELVEPAGDLSPLHKFLNRGGGLHHICYEVDSLDDQLRESRAAKCLVVKNPLPAMAFGGRRIAWVYTPEKLLVEYLER